MKMNRTERTDERTGVEEVGEFTIATTPELFGLLSDGLYTDKILAVIRELSCNAWDAHKEVGNEDTPFTIHLPNDIEPWFSIRDFGTGLSHKDVLGLYTTYGGSTKQHTNDLIGGLGVGSKSPFAYGDSFTVTAYFEGEKRMYTAFLAGDGRPSIAVMGVPENTKEENGLEVSFPVKEDDFNTFYDRAQRILRRFEPLPTVDGGFEEFTLVPVEYDREEDGWKLYNSSSYNANARAIQGKIAYDIDANAMDDLTSQQNALFNMPIEIDFPIGSLDIAASREGLGYKPRTIKTLSDKADEILTELQKLISKEFKTIKTLWDAKAHYATAVNQYSDLDLVVTWKGQTFSDSSFHLDEEDYPSIKLMKCTKRSSSGNLQKKEAMRYGDVSISPSDTTIIVLNDLKTGIWVRTKNQLVGSRMDAGDITTAYVICPAGGHDGLTDKEFKKSFKQMIKDLGDVEVKLASDFPKPERGSGVNGAKVMAKVLERHDRYSNDRDNWDETNIDLNNGGFFVEIKNYRAMDLEGNRFFVDKDSRGYAKNGTEDRCFNKLVKNLKDLGLISEKAPIYGVRTADMKKMSGKWKNVFEIAQKGTKRLVKKHKLSDNMAARQAWSEFDVPNVMKNLDDWDDTTGLFKAFVKKVRKAHDAAQEKSDIIQKLHHLTNLLGIAVADAKVTLDLDDQWEQVVKKYPMLEFTSEGYYGPDADQRKVIKKYLRLANKV